MDFARDRFSYSYTTQPYGHVVSYQPVAFPPYVPISHLDPYYPGSMPDYVDYGQHGIMGDEYDEAGEISTRPRLTREQVEVLEAQFQAHPKPNGVIKLHLAQQTKLSLARVGNWFQNRRAKAKQQRKQEEFENSRAKEPSDTNPLAKAMEAKAEEPADIIPPSDTATSIPTRPQSALTQSSAAVTSPPAPTSQEATLASLQRALTAAQAALTGQVQQARMPELSPPPLPLPELPRHSSTVSLSPAPATQHAVVAAGAPFADWAAMSQASQLWSANHASEHADFNFGFDEAVITGATGGALVSSPPHDVSSTTGYAVSDDDWSAAIPTHPIPVPPMPDSHLNIQLPPTLPQSYSTSRRCSNSDELTTNLGAFALTGTPPIQTPAAGTSALESSSRPDGIAARRNRPPPAALGTAALRSRSYGALTTVSPTMRAASSPGFSGPHNLRHVKSTGASLHTRYAGVRKSSSAQRSPLNINSFAEADALNRLMEAQNAAVRAQAHPDTSYQLAMNPLFAPELVTNHVNGPAQIPGFFGVTQDMPIEHSLQPHATGCGSGALSSPPSTPFKSEFMFPPHVASAMPPVSAPPQYATFPDYTPPYSAGPPTNSSLSDAPLASPEMSSFPLMTHIPSLSLPPQELTMAMPHFMPPVASADVSVLHRPEPKKTEFLIQKFPGQEEEHAHVAQQLAQLKPKAYVFENATPSDYSSSTN